MKIPEFKSPKLRANIKELAEQAANKLAGLDEFSEEIRKLERFFKAVCMPSVSTGYTDPGLGYYGLLWCSNSGRICSFEHDYPNQPDTEEPLADCSAAVRFHAMDEDHLGDLGIAALKELSKMNSRCEASEK